MDRRVLMESLHSMQKLNVTKIDLEESQRKENDLKRDVRLKKAMDLMKGLIPEQPSDITGILMFFKNIENLFGVYKVDDDLKVTIMTPHLNEKSRRVVLQIAHEVTSYEQVKEAILKEHRFSPTLYRKSFLNAIKTNTESYVNFATRLNSLLNMYLDSRNVGGSYDKLVKLLVSDRLKDSLDVPTRLFVTDREQNEWYDPQTIADLVDKYVSERSDYGRNNFSFNNQSYRKIGYD